MTSHNTPPDLKRQILIDLSIRARSGIALYPIIWFITAFWANIEERDPSVFYFVSVICILITLLRVLHDLVLNNSANLDITFMFNSLVALILLSAFCWGVLSAWIIFNDSYPQLHYLYKIIIAVFATAGGSVLSISRIISILYPFLVLGPSLIIAFLLGGMEYTTSFILASFLIAYILKSASASRNDYKKAVYSHILAEDRAVQLQELSRTDPLTGLKNRQFLNHQLPEEWSSCCRAESPLAVLMIDLDHFKQINDNYGHIAGDQCLQHVAHILNKEITRTTDKVARFGGEEFIVLLPHTNLTNAVQKAEQILVAISKADLVVGSHNIPIRCSIGAACRIPEPDSSYEKLIIEADNALYEAKQQGRNQVCISS